ncbi:cation diffusion facilitator family transporter [Alteromonas mediterranea]|uniref:cation diffusion facilitator family transporter n=1 Tax=Alteromonas mediterranea TaxID=314275 RepID=UPI00035564FE|nr:cation diffusion facilitator family transporter [Alteromonas mediterranea]AGP87349.1 Co/Zn/Cd efflux system protein [Alteromonas mediterranea U4]AGP91486.1 Co/Zn/Cd efflux system protein [Alteromonas mediterranea U7]AGP95285.1 Co/Zn/Cd efflux system protein [Alteromonas mediterranea U8]HBL21116.1 cation transporter [Alteromonas mediterranea]|tara:strand:+ start:621 stop:1583 length:963 start_codon:yes stop_codon:yes gene_type:complete
MHHHHSARDNPHSHSHDLENADSTRIGWAFWLNFTFTIIEFIGGWLTNSVAIMADAVHDLGDTLSIGLAWYLSKLGKKASTEKYTYGFKRLSLMGAMINGVILIVGAVWILSEAIPRLVNPEMPVTEGMMGLAVLGILVNGLAAYKLHGGHSMNEKVLNWHLIEDAMGWVAVLIVAIVLHFVNWPILDPILSIGFTLFILINVIRYVVQTMSLFLQGVPDLATRNAISKQLLSIKHVEEIHHVHFWSLDGEQHVLTAHVVINCLIDNEKLRALKQEVNERLTPFGLSHTTIEFELPGEPCRDDKDHLHTHSHSHAHEEIN